MRRFVLLVLTFWYGLVAGQVGAVFASAATPAQATASHKGISCRLRACGCPLDEQRAQRQALHPGKIDPHLPLLSVFSLLPRPAMSPCDGRTCRVLSAFLDLPDKILV